MALGGPPLHLQAGNPVELLLICLRQHAGLHKFRELLAIARQRVVLRHGEACAPDERGSEESQGQQHCPRRVHSRLRKRRCQFLAVHITTPPPAWMFWPVSQRASSLTTKATTSAMSFGVPSRLSGEACSPVWRKAGSAGIMAVSVNPGDTVFTVTPLDASSCARPFVNCSRAPLLPR